jgi:two-component system C4-dicarboxylate transport response regulator DctD
MTDALKILIIEDDPDVALGCEQALQLEGIPAEVAAAPNRRAAAGRRLPGIVVSDIRLPGQDGLSLQRDLHASTRSCRWC